MPEWTMTPFDVPRPVPLRAHTEDDRRVLEMRVANGVAFLLANYGNPEDVETDLGACDDIAETATFIALALEPTLLEDDSEFTISQLPVLGGEICTTAGMHSICIEDDDGIDSYSLVVRDPGLEFGEKEYAVMFPDETLPPIDDLLEIGDALDVIIDSHVQAGTVQNPIPHNTAEYPLPKSNTDFEAIVNGFHDN